MVASHYGVSILPQMAATAFGYERLLKTFKIENEQSLRTIYLTWRASFPRPKLINQLLAAIRPPATLRA
jgi:DNA-binding transcriptional LysR family regulator